jgi:prevent-host-death family protein
MIHHLIAIADHAHQPLSGSQYDLILFNNFKILRENLTKLVMTAIASFITAVTPMKKLNIAEAKAQFSKLVSDAARGKATIIVRGGTPVAKIVPFDQKAAKIKFGTYKGRMVIPGDFDAPDQEIIELFENGPLFPERKS